MYALLTLSICLLSSLYFSPPALICFLAEQPIRMIFSLTGYAVDSACSIVQKAADKGPLWLVVQNVPQKLWIHLKADRLLHWCFRALYAVILWKHF